MSDNIDDDDPSNQEHAHFFDALEREALEILRQLMLEGPTKKVRFEAGCEIMRHIRERRETEEQKRRHQEERAQVERVKNCGRITQDIDFIDIELFRQFEKLTSKER